MVVRGDGLAVIELALIIINGRRLTNPTFPIWTAHPSKFDGMVANFIAVVDPKVAIPGKSALGFNGQPVISLHFGQSPSL